MATLKPVVQKMRADGYAVVYVRVTHNRKSSYIKTNKVVAQRDVSKSGEITDNHIVRYCSDLIYYYHSLLNEVDTDAMSVQEVVSYLCTANRDVCFSDFATLYIRKMFNEGHERNSRTYRLAVSSLEKFLGTTRIMCSQMTSAVLTLWIGSLEHTHRAKEQYPVCVRQIYKNAVLEYNDQERGVVRIKNNPWLKVKIPSADATTKRAISPEDAREFFYSPLPPSQFVAPLAELGRDVAQLTLCLAGINTIDLYNLKKEDYRNGIIRYRRAKTAASRKDGAYFEMMVEPIVLPLMEKYEAQERDPYLFNFHAKYSTPDSFNANVNIGIKKVCAFMGMPKERWYCAYTFRHTWATVAQNDCGANISEVAFGMNHSMGSAVTRGYIKVDFSPAWRLNAEVIDFIFYTNKQSKQGKAMDIDAPRDVLFRLTKRTMVEGIAYYKGERLAEVCDVGFGTVDSVILALIGKLPPSIPRGSAVHFRIRNLDAGKEMVYVREKGKGAAF